VRVTDRPGWSELKAYVTYSLPGGTVVVTELSLYNADESPRPHDTNVHLVSVILIASFRVSGAGDDSVQAPKPSFLPNCHWNSKFMLHLIVPIF
jgi:hypothetical protein